MTGVALGLLLALLVSKGTPIGRSLHRLLVEAPAAWLSSWTRRSVIVVALLTTLLLVAMWVLGHEGVMLTGFALPELGTLLASVEVSSWLDALVVVVGTASLLRAKGVAHWLGARLARPRARSRRPRQPRVAKPSNDDDPVPPGAIRACFDRTCNPPPEKCEVQLATSEMVC